MYHAWTIIHLIRHKCSKCIVAHLFSSFPSDEEQPAEEDEEAKQPEPTCTPPSTPVRVEEEGTSLYSAHSGSPWLGLGSAWIPLSSLPPSSAPQRFGLGCLACLQQRRHMGAWGGPGWSAVFTCVPCPGSFVLCCVFFNF